MSVKKIILFMLFSAGLLLVSCIRDQALNMEADIEAATIPDATTLLQDQPVIGDNTIVFKLREFTGSYFFAPEFSLTPGASIKPAGGTRLDFTEPQKYTVTSEDGAWTKVYTVSFVADDTQKFSYSFEEAEVIDTDNPVGHFHRFFDYLSTGQKKYDWATANEGYNVLAETLVEEGELLTPAFYPTAQVPDGYMGKGVKMQTKGTGPLGGMFGSPMAAGNLFLGTFKLTVPAIKSTLFGMSYNFKTAPKSVKGYFKYKAGKDFVINSKTGSNLTRDTWDAYAILFEKSDKNNYLSGDHAFRDARMVSVARIKADKRVETDQWTAFEIPFENVNGKSFDKGKEYMFTIVFSSSLEGDLFNGAVGSTLWVDEVKIVTE